MNEMNAIDPRPRSVDADSLKAAIVDKLAYAVGKDPIVAQPHDWLAATILVVRDRAIDRWMDSTRGPYRTGAKRVYYLSVEFLIGRLLRDAMSNLGLVEPIAEALASLGVDLDAIEALEPDAALGNGGLGRLAACFMESMATVGIPAYGYGIRYVHGLFHQEIQDGNQIELPEDWLSDGNLWEFERREAAYDIGFGGSVESDGLAGDTVRQRWHPQEKVLAIAYDTPIVGWRGARVNTLRLWSARAVNQISLDEFNRGDHMAALADLTRADTITRVLYPADSTAAGQELRLRQEYFFVSASLQDLLRRHLKQFGTVENLADKVAVQLNDTHPSIAVAELMRILVDLHGIAWDAAWSITRDTISYTNHTLLPEALESWSVGLMERLLPRHMQIIYEINSRLLQTARRTLDADADLLASLSLIDEHSGRRVRMGQLAFVGSHKVNGVSALHTELMKETVFRNLHRLFPDRIENKTNGIATRRWLMQANPGLTDLIVEAIGPAVLDDIGHIAEVDAFAGDTAFQERFAAVKRANKVRLADPRPRHRRRLDQPGRALRRPHQAHPRIQAPVPQHHRDGRPLQPDPAPSRAGVGAAGQDLRRQGGGELLDGEADHPSHQRRGEGDQQRSDRPRPPQGRVPAELQCQPRRGDRAGRRPVGTDLDRRHGGLGHRQHEAGAERRDHHRHPRRRQCRDLRARRYRQYLHLRAHRRRGRRAPPHRPQPARHHRRRRCAALPSSMLSPTAPSRPTTATAIAA